jgi:hypothetical protein
VFQLLFDIFQCLPPIPQDHDPSPDQSQIPQPSPAAANIDGIFFGAQTIGNRGPAAGQKDPQHHPQRAQCSESSQHPDHSIAKHLITSCHAMPRQHSCDYSLQYFWAVEKPFLQNISRDAMGKKTGQN